MANWSYSQLAHYRRCPFQYKCDRIDKLPKAAFDVKGKFIGVLLERLVQAFYIGNWWHDPSTVVLRMEGQVLPTAIEVTNEEHITWFAGEREHWTTVAKDAIPKILRVIRDEKLVTGRVYVEQELRVQVGGGHSVYGRSDFIFERPDGTISAVLDGKGGGSIGKHVQADQLRLYAIGTGQSPTFRKQFPDRIGFWWYRHGKVVWKRVVPSLITRFEQGVRATIARLMAGDFTPRTGGHCKYCDYKVYCPTGREYLRQKAARKTVFVTEDNSGEISL